MVQIGAVLSAISCRRKAVSCACVTLRAFPQRRVALRATGRGIGGVGGRKGPEELEATSRAAGVLIASRVA